MVDPTIGTVDDHTRDAFDLLHCLPEDRIPDAAECQPVLDRVEIARELVLE